MTELNDILGQIPVDQIAGILGTDRQTAQAAVEAAVPTLLAGMHNNAQAPDGAAALESALGQHQNGLTDGGIDVAQVDRADGEKIVSHVFAGQQDQVANQLAGTAQLGGVDGDLVKKLLPVLAPIVMSYLARKVLGGGQPSGAGGAGRSGGIDLGGILGGILGGAAGAGGAGRDGQGGIGGLLGGLLGGGQAQGQDPAQDRQLAPDAGLDSRLDPETAPMDQSPGQSSGGAPVPGELVEVDLPEGQQEEPKNDGGDGIGGLLGGLLGKK